ncbi:hypothetical protein LEQ41_08270 [Streptococcus agalactiae]|nr:hypothetical protein [Streptococcus agalactiae]
MPKQLLLLCCCNFGKDEYSRMENRLFLKLQRYLLITSYYLVISIINLNGAIYRFSTNC